MPSLEETPEQSEDLCNEQVAQCYCGKPARHGELGDWDHVCSYGPCNGSWRGRSGTEFFEVVRLPSLASYFRDPSADAWRNDGK